MLLYLSLFSIWLVILTGKWQCCFNRKAQKSITAVNCNIFRNYFHESHTFRGFEAKSYSSRCEFKFNFIALLYININDQNVIENPPAYIKISG